MEGYFWCWRGWLNIIKTSLKNKVNECTEKKQMDEVESRKYIDNQN